jgi:hypothetical protein
MLLLTDIKEGIKGFLLCLDVLSVQNFERRFGALPSFILKKNE